MRRVGARSVAATGTVLGAVLGTVLGTVPGGLLVTQAGAATSTATAASGAAGDDGRLRPQARFAREVVRRGDRDAGVRAIEHVTELQYRLRRAGAYRGPVTGRFRRQTEVAVKRFQQRVGLQPSGVVTGATWEQLLPRTVRNRDALPRRCTRGGGWHACYDRSRHQVTLWKRGTLWNTWLVRGGRRGHETRPGHFRVYWRDRDHVSSIYGTAMPYSQFFDGGEAFHGSPSMLDPYRGHSHGCVTLYIEDARQLWRLTHRVGLAVSVYGHWD